MKKLTLWVPLTVAALALSVAGEAMAKVTTAEADRLGKDLTCVGAVKAGNKAGTIPEFTGKWLGTPPGIKYKLHVGARMPDPYASEKPLFVITAQNAAQYADNLSDGQKAMLARHPATYKIPVYPGHRDFRYPDSVCAVTEKNAREAQIAGLGFTGYMGGTPFPIPKSGIEALQNQNYPYRAWTETVLKDIANVDSTGSIAWGRNLNKNLSLVNDPANSGKPMTGVQAYSLNLTQLPSRDKGRVSLGVEPTSYSTEKRLTWIYDPGTRRVRQAPEYGFDQPLAGTGGKMTIDSDRLFNGSPERYDWKLMGKREMFIPANTYKTEAHNVKYADLLKPGHANPDFMRYELRRVWVLQGTLNTGYRHLYAKRVMFLDEDTWMAVMTDLYDARDQLWQTAMVNHYYAPDMEAWEAGSSFYYDLNSGGYVGYNLTQERELGPILNRGDLTPSMYTPDAARVAGQ